MIPSLDSLPLTLVKRLRADLRWDLDSHPLPCVDEEAWTLLADHLLDHGDPRGETLLQTMTQDLEPPPRSFGPDSWSPIWRAGLHVGWRLTSPEGLRQWPVWPTLGVRLQVAFHVLDGSGAQVLAQSPHLSNPHFAGAGEQPHRGCGRESPGPIPSPVQPHRADSGRPIGLATRCCSTGFTPDELLLQGYAFLAIGTPAA